MKNIELKVSIDNFKKIVDILKNINAIYNGVLHQEDVYYYCNSGRLKLRNINNKNFELIFYQRPDKKIGKISDYQRLKIEPKKFGSIELILDNALGKRITVKKERKLWIYRNTRIHLDSVHRLGRFLELETAVGKNGIKKAEREYGEILKLFNLKTYKICSESYCDLSEKLQKNYPINNTKHFQMKLESLIPPSDLFNSVRTQLNKIS